MQPPKRARRALITIAHAVIGWTLCGATMGIGMAVTTLENALVVHAAAAPVIFAGVSAVYFRRLGHLPPLKAAVAFLMRPASPARTFRRA